MPTEVLATPRAEQQIAGLARRRARQFNDFLDDLAARGCAALAYRLSGTAPIDHLCVKHLAADLRVVVAFESSARAWVLLVGPHDERNAVVNVYAELYRLLGVDPEPDAGRTKPPCCDRVGQQPPLLGAQVDEIVHRANELRRTRQRR